MKKFFKKGLTLIELLITISIIGILVGATVPTLSKYIPGISLNGAAKTLVATLREAQEKTITEQKPYLVRFNTSSSPPYYELIRLNNTLEELQRKTELNTSETISLADTITNNQIIFSPDGGPSSNGDITLSNGTANKIVDVSPAGFISAR